MLAGNWREQSQSSLYNEQEHRFRRNCVICICVLMHIFIYTAVPSGPSNGNILHPGSVKLERRRTVSVKKPSDDGCRYGNTVDTKDVSKFLDPSILFMKTSNSNYFVNPHMFIYRQFHHTNNWNFHYPTKRSSRCCKWCRLRIRLSTIRTESIRMPNHQVACSSQMTLPKM